MSDPIFLTLDDVLTIHARMLAAFGGSDGILNPGALESAVSSPQASYGGHFLNEFPFEMAAAYIIGVAKNHAFADGNKRTAAAIGEVFLRANGFKLLFDPVEYADLILAVATSELKKAALTKALSENSKRL
jgi:death-on-curing protein